MPFHRYYVTVHETLLRDECGFAGWLPYWDEAAEVDNMALSELFEDQYYGGNEDGSSSYIADGPFINMTLRFLANNQIADHCLSRHFDQFSFNSAAQYYVDKCDTFKKYAAVWYCLTLAPHTAGYNGVGGTVSLVFGGAVWLLPYALSLHL
jgi:tyrosinase